MSARGRTLVERTLESELETIIKTEKTTTEEDEISDAVKEDNRSDTKFGVNATANQGWIGGSASASASLNIDYDAVARRASTRTSHMRQQTEKLSTEIRKNFKSTFETVTETTDTSSKRYVLSNTTDKLINYELRRKMRQVGVQVQDIGTYLCWQTYVDDPGRQLASPSSCTSPRTRSWVAFRRPRRSRCRADARPTQPRSTFRSCRRPRTRCRGRHGRGLRGRRGGQHRRQRR